MCHAFFVNLEAWDSNCMLTSSKVFLMAADFPSCCSGGNSPALSMKSRVRYTLPGTVLPHGSLAPHSKKSANSPGLSGHGLPNVTFIQFLTFAHVLACFLNVDALLPFPKRRLMSTPSTTAALNIAGASASRSNLRISSIQRVLSSFSAFALRSWSSPAR